MTRDRVSGAHGPGPHQEPHDEPQDDDVRATARDSDSDTSHAAWSALADELIAALTALDRYIEIKARTAEGPRDQDRSLDVAAADAANDAGLEEVRSHLHQGAGRAAAQLGHLAQAAPHAEQDGEIAETAASWSTAHRRPFDHSLIQLVQAYGAAFGTVEAATTSLARTPAAHMPGAAGRLVELAVRSAKGLRQAMDLAFGQQGLGTVQHLCDHIATLENQADALYHSAVATALSRPRTAGQAARWTAEDAEHIRRLATLEALTDRCEEIAEALLLAEYLL